MKRIIVLLIILFIISGCSFFSKKEEKTDDVVDNPIENVISEKIENTVEEETEHIDELPVVDSEGNSLEIEQTSVLNVPDSASVSSDSFDDHPSQSGAADNSGSDGNHGASPNELPIIEYNYE